MQMGLRDSVLGGLSWSLASRVGTQAFQFVFQIILARLLTPQEFGVVGMLLIFIGFAQTLADCGLSSALVYDQNATDSQFSTVFWLQVAAGAILSAVFFTGAPLLASFYDTPALEPLSQLVAPIFLLQALGQTHSARLSKNFRFKQMAVVSVSSTFGSGAIAVVLAKLDYGVWALAWQALIATIITTGLLWFQSRWVPSLQFNRADALRLGKYGIYLLGHGSLNYWLRNADKLAIGKFLGAHDLGIYSRAYSLMLLPLNNISAVLGQVMFPALARLQNDAERFRSAYVSATRMIALVSFPLMTGVASLCEPLVLFLLGDKWSEVIPVLQILSFVGLIQSVVFPVGWIFTALGKTKDQFYLSILLSLIFVVLVGVGILYGIVGIALGYACWTVISGWLNLHIAGRYVALSVMTVVVSLVRILGMALVMGALVFGVDQTVLSGSPTLLRLTCGAILGVTSYAAMCFLSKDATFQELSGYLSSRLSLPIRVFSR